MNLHPMTRNASTASRSGNIRIREASDDDVEALTKLINAAFVVEQVVFDGDRVDDLGVRAYMSGGTFFIAEDSSEVAGCVYIETRDDRSYLVLLSVQPARQGKMAQIAAVVARLNVNASRYFARVFRYKKRAAAHIRAHAQVIDAITVEDD